MRIPTLLLLLTACGTDAAPGPEPIDGPTYWTDVEPLLYTKCSGCHANGGIAPFSFENVDTVVELGPMIAAATSARTMPPWPPGGDTPPLLHDRSLTQDEIDLLSAWVENGMQIGDPAKRGARVEPEVVDIGTPELGFDIGVDYVPDGNLTDDYRCFVVPLDAPALRMATGFRVTPGNRATVHHVIVSLYNGDDLATFQALDAETPERPGWPCVGGAVPTDTTATPAGSLGAWVPGMSAVAYPIGTASPIPANAIAVMQMHYNLLGGMEPDRTRVEVALAPAADNASLIRLSGIGTVKRNLQIPIDDPNAVNQASATVSQWRALRGGQPFPSGTGYAVGVGGHMHVIGKRIVLSKTDATGEHVLLDIPAWSFHWQGQYQFATPIPIANTDTLTIRCEYDNSNVNRLAHDLPPNMEVTWGEGTLDEMCLSSLAVVDRLP